MRLALVGVLAFTAACGGNSPTQPSVPSSGFLAGRWSGTLTIVRPGQLPATGPTEWVFEAVPQTGGYSYRASVTSSNPWFAPSFSGTADLVAPGQPPATVSTQGDYLSPRGCRGQFGSFGTASMRSLTATFHGVDCQNVTFDGTVELSR